MSYILSVVGQIAPGIGASLILFVLTLIFSMPLGLVICFGRMSRFRPLSMVVNFIISVLRGTPLMLQLVVVFFGPYYVFGLAVSNTWRFWAAVVGFSINYAAYFAEIYRAGIQSIPVGQYEAAEILGYSRSQTFCKIIFPQMVKRVLPPVTNEIITLTKDTSLAFVLAYAEMFTLAKQVAAAQSSIAPLFVAGLFYYVFNYVVAFAMDALERKLAYYQ
ncbi:MAG: amino acid ABC transporter permease [Clostridiales bacterium]|nr:amino acid ABC transporter permease [Clostridiales bacterium]